MECRSLHSDRRCGPTGLKNLLRTPVVAVALLVLCLLAAEVAWPQDDAQRLYDQGVTSIDRFVDHFRRTFDRSSFGAELDRAERALTESARLFAERRDPAGAARSLVKLADLRRYRDQWDAAIETYRQAAEIAAQAQAHDAECKALMGHARALLYGKQAPADALALVEKALPLAVRVEDPSYRFDAWDLLAQTQAAQGDLVAAADSLNRAFSVKEAIEDETLLFYAYLDRADVYQKLAEKCDYQREFQPCLDAVALARRDYEAALAAAEKLRWDGLAEQTRGFLHRLGIREQMIRSQMRMHEMVAESGVFSPRELDDVAISASFVAGENPQLSGLLAWIETQGGLPASNDARGAYIRGLLSEMSGESDVSLEWYLRATELLEGDRRALHEERTRASFVEDKVEFYYAPVLHLLERGRREEAFAIMQRSRSRVISDLLATKDLALSSPEERALYARMLELRSRIAQYQACLLDVRSGWEPGAACAAIRAPQAAGGPDRGVALVPAEASASASDPGSLEHALAQLEQAAAKTRSDMAEQTPRLARLIISEPVSLAALQKTLAGDGSELVAYLSLESQLLIWHVTPESVHVVSVFLPRSVLKRKVEQLRESLVDPKRTFAAELAHELYLFLIAPVRERVSADHLVIVPHDDLHYLPFQALQTRRGEAYLGDELQISYAPSASILVSLADPEPVREAKLLAVADPSLAFAPQEVRSLGERYPGRVVSEALPAEAQVKSWLPDNTLVHFAVHGRFEGAEPLLSHLHLAAGDGDDGKLTAAEMYGLPLDAARLVVLSACETGSVRATHANEVLGMLRGLLFSGADAVLLSAWKIDDAATALWMQAFYEAAASTSPAAAAWAATKALRTNAAYRHPYYWSPFLLTSR